MKVEAVPGLRYTTLPKPTSLLCVVQLGRPPRAMMTENDTFEVTFAGAAVRLGVHELRAQPAVALAGGPLVGSVGVGVADVVALARARGLALPARAGALRGAFAAADGLATAPIGAAELARGTLVHSDAGGAPLARGGPLRAVFPPGVAVQASPCGRTAPANVKGAVRLALEAAS